MDQGFGWVVLVAVLAWVGNVIYQGYKAEKAPPLTLADNGHGMKEPICPACQARLVTITREVRGASVCGPWLARQAEAFEVRGGESPVFQAGDVGEVAP